MKHKYFFIKGEVRDGEHEYLQQSTYRSIGAELKEGEIERFAQEWWGFGEGSYQEVRLRSTQEIPFEDYLILQKYSI